MIDVTRVSLHDSNQMVWYTDSFRDADVNDVLSLNVQLRQIRLLHGLDRGRLVGLDSLRTIGGVRVCFDP